MLLAAYLLSFVDRNVLVILVGPIRKDFAISDFQFSLLHGWSFTLIYIVLGARIGWLADRFSRRWIIVVGVGEATLSPAAHSLMSDYRDRVTGVLPARGGRDRRA